MTMKPIGRGSSKDLYVDDRFKGYVFFEFSDRVSVFDYGALPDAIPGKGDALERAARFFFGVFEAAGLSTAFDLETSTRAGKCALRAARHPKFPAASDERAELEFIPLEVIFRWGVVPGSSWLKRHPAVAPYTRFAQPVIEFSTKLEATDRLLDESEAAQLAGGEARLRELRDYAESAARLLRQTLQEAGLELWDGKIECARHVATGKITLVDAITPDELRVSVPGLESVPFSKELLRHWMAGTDWAFQIKRAKAAHGDAWKQQVVPPPRLGRWRISKFAALYASFAEALETRSSRALLEWSRRDAMAPRVFVTGQGGRETAVRWRLQQEGCVIATAPESADVVWVSPDADLAAGLVDKLSRDGFWTYGPVQQGARVEWSKSFGKEIAEKAGVQLPQHSENAADLRKFAAPPVVKYDGLAAGKGVVVPESWEEAEQAVKELSQKGPVVFEERLRGFEASAFFAVETGYYGTQCRFLGTARDFKRRYLGNEGPNTGGMGSHAPHPEVTEADVALFREWAQTTARALAEQGIPYNGVLYLGCLKDERQGWRLLEYNARLGDPETEALVCAWPDGPVLRQLLKLDVRVDARDIGLEHHAVCVALVRREYPQAAPPLQLPAWEFGARPSCVLFRNEGGSGRVAFVVGRGDTLLEAGDRAFGALVDSPWKDQLEWRTDILP